MVDYIVPPEVRERDRAEAEAKKQKEIAINSIKNGADDAFTAKITGLSLKEVQELRKEIELKK